MVRRKGYRFLAVLLLLAAGVVAYSWYTGNYYFFTLPPQKSSDPIMLTATFNEKVPLRVKVLTTTEDLRKGLSGTVSLAPAEGRLFVFSGDGYRGIWMKDMLFPIDIIWVDAEGIIVSIEENVRPDTFPKTFEPPRPARFVIETNSYFATSFNIRVGDRVEVLGYVPYISVPQLQN